MKIELKKLSYGPRKLTSIVTLFIFLVWIIPLGAFIKPEQEEKACNGRRAICLCLHLVKQQTAKMSGMKFVKAGASTVQQPGSSPSFGTEFIIRINNSKIHLAQNKFFAWILPFTNFLFARQIDHVPKI